MITKTRLFVSGNAIERLEETGTIERDGHECVVVQPDNMVFKTARAFHFLASLSGADDWRMEGRVLTESEVLRLSGHVRPGRVHFGPRVYEVQEGVVGELVSERAGTPAPSQAPGATAPSPDGAEDLSPDDIGAALSYALAGDPEPEPPAGGERTLSPGAAERARRSSRGTTSAGSAPPVSRPTEPQSPEEEELLVRFLLEGN